MPGGDKLRVILLGPQGSGKGTQADLLSARTKARHIAMGKIVREEISSGSALGGTLHQYADRGELVPDAIILALIRPLLAQCTDWVLDGFPRDLAQARALDDVLHEENCPLDRVVALELPDSAVLARLSGRRESAATGEVYHLLYNPPPPGDPGPFVVRTDDEPHAIKRRLELYHTATEPLKEYYKAQGLLIEIDAQGSIEDVRHRLFAALGV